MKEGNSLDISRILGYTSTTGGDNDAEYFTIS